MVGAAGTLEKARALLATEAPDVVLLDHRLPDGDGVEAIPDLLALRPEASIVVLTATTADHVLVAAIEGGASGFVSKTRGLDEVTSAVRAAAAGESVISPEMLARLLPRLHRREAAPRDTLTEREREVLAAARRGPVQRGDRRAAVRQRAHRAQPRRQPVDQARRALEARGALDRRARGPAATLLSALVWTVRLVRMSHVDPQHPSQVSDPASVQN